MNEYSGCLHCRIPLLAFMSVLGFQELGHQWALDIQRHVQNGEDLQESVQLDRLLALFHIEDRGFPNASHSCESGLSQASFSAVDRMIDPILLTVCTSGSSG